MHNATIDILTKKVAQLDAMIAVLCNTIGTAAEDGLSSTDRGNFAWAMADLLADIKTAVAAVSEVSHVA